MKLGDHSSVDEPGHIARTAMIGSTLRKVADLLTAAEEGAATAGLSLLRDLEAALNRTEEDRSAERKAQGFDPAILAARVKAFPLSDQSLAAPAPGAVEAFRFETDGSGIICWVEGAPRAAIIGLALPVPTAPQRISAFRGMEIEIAGEGTASGHWLASGVPVFAPHQGHFLGYRGSARRGEAPDNAIGAREHPDLVRQLVHEIRTPLNAILGFAGLIENEMLGPSEPDRRARAAGIVKEAQRILAIVEDMDLRARAGGAT